MNHKVNKPGYILQPLKVSGVLLGLLLFGLFEHAMAIGDGHTKQSRQLLERGAKLTFNKHTGKTRFIGTPANQAIRIPGTDPAMSAEHNSRAIMQTYGQVFGIQNPDRQLRLKRQRTRANGRSMVRYQQVHNGIPVFGGELIVNLDEQQRLVSMNGETSDIKGITTTIPNITPEQAGTTALNAIAKIHQVDVTMLKTSTAELKIYDPRLVGPQTHEAQLVWQVEVTSTDRTVAIRELVLIDAINNTLSLHFNQVHTAKNRLTYDANNTQIIPRTAVCNEAGGCANGASADALQAHQFAGDTYDFFMNSHGRDGMDGNGGAIISLVNLCIAGSICPLDNAFWDGTRVIYGQGLTKDDIVAHELTHAFTEHTSDLFYYYQSGAINESLSDVWGEFIDQSNTGGDELAGDLWYIGEDMDPAIFGKYVYRGALRSMADPTAFGDPDKMSSTFYHRSADDSGGVHVNSGINNKAVYLMTEPSPKTFLPFTGPGIGIEKVATIYYEVQTSMLTSGSDYADLYAAVNQACTNLIGGPSGISAGDCVIVKNALDAVEMNLDPTDGLPTPAPFNPDAPLCDPGDTPPTYAFYDDFESGMGKWSFTNLLGGRHYWQDMLNVYGVPYSTSGTHSLFVEGVPVRADQTGKITVKVPTRRPYLHFRHAYDLEHSVSAFYDGGVIEYSTNNGISWNSITNLNGVSVQAQDYNGSIYSLFGNPLAGRSAFVGLSHGYVSSRYNLNSLAGQQVSFRWRIGTDSDNNTAPTETFGWIIDDVSVYSCDNTAPTAPILLSPDNNASFSSNSNIDFLWTDATDPDVADTLTHTVLVCQGVNCLPINPYVSLAGILQQTPALAGLGTASILLLGFAGAAGRRRILLLMALGLSLLLSSSCGGGGSSTTVIGPPPPPPPPPVTTTYRWRVQADDGNSVTYSEIRSYTVTR